MAERQTDDTATMSKLNRRSYLALAGAAGVAAGTAGLLGGSTGSASADRQTVDLGAEGLQDGDAIDDYLAEHFDNGTAVHIPPGSYEWNGEGLDGDYENAALIGDGKPGAVELNFPEGEHRYNAVRAQAGEVRLENFQIRGATGGEEAKLRAEARGEDATMVLDKIWLPDGVEDGADGVGIYVGAEHAGTIRIVDCWVQNFSDNGLYASGPGADFDDAENGKVIVEGGLFRNNNISNVRIGTDGAEVRNVAMVHDGQSPPNDGVYNQRNLRIRQPGQNMVVDSCDIYHSIDHSQPIDLSEEFSGGEAVIKNTRVLTNSDSPVANEHGGDYLLKNVHLKGDGNHEIAVETENVVEGSNAQKATPAAQNPVGDRS
ncbi:hypothetical protein SAMN06269185_1557 [Natronoarchaeum philippinense]|uniref:Right handed beta helix region n=1 Tax=Natronoarchaeum philippinense TaxID=558529 RepID=A0A285NX46_NATPI|nr:hypothetical protein [Natronoarchaeum philippinense]SNZ12221.1 hypothetical protein SAMN06269185_1557 [Natronoarchaeum philippinense]